MNTQTTPLVQKLILGTLVLILGCLVLLLVNGRKQIESLREGNGPALADVGDSNSAPSMHKAFPSIRSSRAPVSVPVATPETPTVASEPAPAAAPTPRREVVQQPPTVLPAATVIEPPEAVAQEGVVFGQVLLVGAPPQEKVIRFDQMCGAMHGGIATTRNYIVSRDGGLANVFVYISKGKGVDSKTFPAPKAPVLLDQKNCMYQPYVVGAMVNQPIQIKNSDPLLHNVHALPRANGNNEFNFAQPVQNQVDERTFPSPEVFVKLKCEVHDWMFAYVAVASNPYFAVTDKDGVFHLPANLPPGKYEITATHLRAGTATQQFVMKKDAAVRLDFRLKVDGKNAVVRR